MTSDEIVDPVPVRAYVDEAPGKTQVYHAEYGIDQGLGRHHFFFSVGLNVGTAACEIPSCGADWHGILHPVVMSDWPARSDPRCRRFTSISNWAEKETFALNGRFSGEKADNWWRFASLPALTEQELELMLNAGPGYESDVEELRSLGWLVRDPARLRTVADYRGYIGRSRGEFSVTNNRYVEFRTGWTSDRSMRYLASGKPVLVQSTGIENHLPTGKGLLTFTSVDEAVAGIEEINSDYVAHCRAARAVAEEHCDAERVLGGMLATMGL